MKLSAFWQFFRPTKKAASDSNKILKDKGKIAIMLKYFTQDRILARVHLPSDSQEFNSAILSVDKDHQTFQLDELTPEDGNTTLATDKSVYISGQVRGINVNFQAELKRSDQSGIALHTLHFPKEIEYLQRRNFYRAKISAANPITFSAIHKDTKRSITGTITDISIQGIGIIVNYNGAMYPSETLNGCRLILPNKETISLSITIRQVQKIKSHAKHRIGCQFAQIDSNSRKKIERMIRTLERKQLRNQKKL